MRLRAVFAVGVVALGATACGAGETGPQSAGSVPDRPTTSIVPTSPTAPSGEAPATTDVIVYLTRGEQAGRFTRAVPRVPRIGAEAVKALLRGPTDDERRAGVGTAIPAGTEFRDLTIEDGVAKVDLSRTFESGGGTLGLTLRLAQVTCTLDEFPTVSGVRFALDGRLVDVLSGEGVVVDKPVTCDTYREVLAVPPPSVSPAPIFVGIWPFTSQAEVDTYLAGLRDPNAMAGSDQTFRDPTRTAREFAVRYLGMVDPVTFPVRVANRVVEVPVGFRAGEPSMFVQLQGLADGDRGPWVVVGATSPQIVVDIPATLATVSSPVTLMGKAAVFEGNVNVEVREDGMLAGRTVGTGFVTGRGDGVLGAFRGDVEFRRPRARAGAIVFQERSAEDGRVLRATVVRVGFRAI